MGLDVLGPVIHLCVCRVGRGGRQVVREYETSEWISSLRRERLR